MSCIADVKKAILDDIFNKYVNVTKTYKREGLDTIVVTQQVKNKSNTNPTGQAGEAIENVLRRITQGYNGHVRAEIIRPISIYDGPIKARLEVNPAYIKHVFDKQANKGDDLASVGTSEERNKVQYQLKAVNILVSPKADEVFRKGDKNGWSIDKILNELQIPIAQQELLKSYNTRNREQLLTNLLADYSYTIEINTAKDNRTSADGIYIDNILYYIVGNILYSENKEGDINVVEKDKEKEVLNQINGINGNTQHYSNLTVPGGINYTENEIATPAITPSIKGHAQFSTDNGIGWARMDDKAKPNIPKYDVSSDANKTNEEGLVTLGKINIIKRTEAKIRRVLEIQSDLFQKARKNFVVGITQFATREENRKTLYERIVGSSPPSFISKEKYNEAFEIWLKDVQNPFLSLLQRDNNWVTFFVKALVQDSAKDGYENVLFPTGDTAAKIEGHETVQGFIDNKEKNLKRLTDFKKEQESKQTSNDIFDVETPAYINNDNEIAQLEKEIEDAKAGKLKISSIAKFYEDTVYNVLKKQGYNPERITDEYGNDWYSIKIEPKHKDNVLLSVAPSESLLSEDEEHQNEVNNNTASGEAIEDEIANPSVGIYVNYIKFKEKLIYDYKQRLKAAENESDSKNVKPERLRELNTEKRKLKNSLYGTNEQDKKGLIQEVYELKKRANELVLGYYVEKDLNRLNELVKSSNIGDLNEAESIIELYERGGTFIFPKGKWNNPFFLDTDVYITDDNGALTTSYKLQKEDIKIYQDWANKASVERITIGKKRKEIANRVINSNVDVNKTFGEQQLDIDEINDANNLKDTHWIDMYVLDPTKNIFNRGTIIQQVQLSELQQEVLNMTSESTEIAHQVDKISDKVINKLKEVNLTLKNLGIKGFNQGAFSIYLERNKNNQLTGNYSYKYNQDYTNKKTEIESNFLRARSEAYLLKDSKQIGKALADAFKTKKDWDRANNIILEFQKIPEIHDDVRFGVYESQFDRSGAEAYKKQIINIIGEKEYNNQVEEQKRLLVEYGVDKKDFEDSIMEEQNITDINELSDANNKAAINWVLSNSPFFGINHYYQVDFNSEEDAYNRQAGNLQRYNVLIPRKNKAERFISKDKKRYIFQDTDKKMSINYYNEDFEKYIEADDTLYEFHKILKNAMDFIKRVAPPDIAEKLAFNYLSALEKTSAEIITTNYDQHNILERISPSFGHLWENVRLGFGVNKQSNISHGSKEGTINDSFLRSNQIAIDDKINLEKIKFKQAFNTKSKSDDELVSIGKFSKIPLSEFNENSLILLSDFLGITIPLEDIKRGNISKIRDITGDDVQIYNVIKDYSTHEIVQDNSFDLPRLIKHFTYQAAYYAAKSKALPRLALLKNFSDNIENVKRNNLGEVVTEVPDGTVQVKELRTHSNRRDKSWWERVMLGHNSRESKGIIGSKEDKLFGQTIYSKQDRAKFKEINALLGEGKEENIDTILKRIKEINKELANPENFLNDNQAIINEKIGLSDRYELLKIRQKLGKTRTLGALYDSILGWIRFQRLAWNVNSGITNAVEGYFNNMIIAADGNYFTANNIYRAYGLIYHSLLKNVTFGLAETGTARKIRILSDRYDYLNDQSNENQKASTKTFSDKNEWLRAMALTKRVEYMNQGVIMLATLMDAKIRSIDGTKEQNVLDAMDNEARLLPEFRTKENIDNWENKRGDQFSGYYTNLNNALELAHGNYDILRGMMAKESTAGKALMMFKTWLPQQIYWRFATEQTDIASGSIKFKGKYLSYGVGSGALQGIIAGTLFAGPVGALAGAVGGAIFGKWASNHYQRDSVGLLKETLVSATMLVKKMFGMPLNTLTHRNLIETNKLTIGGKEYGFDSWVGKGGFTEQDARALNSNMSDMAMELTMIALMLIIKAMFWDDDDDPKAPERLAHNLLINKIMQLSSQSTSYVNILDKNSAYQSTIGSVAILSYLTDVGKVAIDANKALNGEDTEQTGIDAGQSRTWNQVKQTFVPGALKSPFSGGFENSTQRQFLPSPFDYYFKENIPKHRKELRTELIGRGIVSKSVQDILINKEYPTRAKLKKSGLTRKEWLQKYNSDSPE